MDEVEQAARIVRETVEAYNNGRLCELRGTDLGAFLLELDMLLNGEMKGEPPSEESMRIARMTPMEYTKYLRSHGWTMEYGLPKWQKG